MSPSYFNETPRDPQGSAGVRGGEMDECSGRRRLLGLSAVASASIAGLGGLAFYKARGGDIHLVLGVFWILMALASWRVYKSLGC